MASHLIAEEREILYRMRKEGTPIAQIARLMGRARSTIYRELERNTGGRGYRPKQAQSKADARRSNCRRPWKMDNPRVRDYVARRLKKKWSPDQIAGRCRVDFPREPDRWISRQTIYDWIARWAPAWRVHLRRGGRRRGRDRRGQLVGCTSIAGRPKVVDTRRRYGDWEGDTVVGRGRRGGLVTMVERKSGYLRMRKIENLKSATTIRATQRCLEDLPKNLLRTLTLDNGKEFAQHEQLTEQLSLDVYFTDTGAPYQRGTNENTNGLTRQFYSKKTDFVEVSHREVAHTEKLINERPRRRLGYQTPSEVLTKRTRRN